MRTQKYAEETRHEFWCAVWSVVFRYARGRYQCLQYLPKVISFLQPVGDKLIAVTLTNPDLSFFFALFNPRNLIMRFKESTLGFSQKKREGV